MNNPGINHEGSLENGERIEIPEFADLTIPDTEELQKQILESSDIGYIPKETLESLSFDTTFKWPKKLPEGFNPERLIEDGKNPGLGIRTLHEQGITGKGVTVGIIDQKISLTHTEFKDNIIGNSEYRSLYIDIEDEKQDDISMHGPAVVSLLAGKHCGVAPDTKVLYEADLTPGGGYDSYIKSLEDIIEYNKNNEQKIKIVSVSKGHLDEPNLKEWIEVKEKAKNLGITVIDSEYFGQNFITDGGSKNSKDDFIDYELSLFYKASDIQAPSVEDMKSKLSLADDSLRNKFFDKYKSIENYIDGFKNIMIVPSDYRAMASGRGDSEYRYDASGGWSWAIPYFAGVFVLALQVNPDLTSEQFLGIAKSTAGKNKNGIKVINPIGIIEEVKKTVTK